MMPLKNIQDLMSVNMDEAGLREVCKKLNIHVDNYNGKRKTDR